MVPEAFILAAVSIYWNNAEKLSSTWYQSRRCEQYLLASGKLGCELSLLILVLEHPLQGVSNIPGATSTLLKTWAISLSTTGLGGIAARISCLLTLLVRPNNSSGPSESSGSPTGPCFSRKSSQSSKTSFSSAIYNDLVSSSKSA